MSAYTYSNNGSTWNSLTDAGFQDLIRTRHNAEVDTFTMQRTAATAFTDDPGLFSYGADIRIRQDSTQIFRGLVDTLPRMASGVDENYMVRLAGPWRQLQKCTYQQTWKAWTGSAVADITKSRVILFQNAAGTRITTGAQIEDAIDYAIARGVAITKGTIDAGVQLPTDERDNLSVADVIHTVLRWFPDLVCWFDYSTTAPTFHCRKRSSLSAVSKAITDGDLISIVAREDRQVSGIVIKYELTHDEDGVVYKTVSTDSAGTTTAVDTVFATFDLEGTRRTYVRQKVVTADMPDPFSIPKSWFKANIPALRDVDDDDMTIRATALLNPSNFPRYLVAGQIPDWMNKDSGIVEISGTFDLTVRNPDSGSIADVMRNVKYVLEVTGTDATTRTYKRLTSFDAGESVPSGVADALYASWNTLEHEGDFVLTAAEPTGFIGPGNAFNLTAGRTPWATMAALVQTVTEQYDEGITRVSFGPPRNLDADTLVALFRALRSRRYSWSRTTRSTGSTDGEGDVELGGAPVIKNVSQGQSDRERFRVMAEDADENEHDIDLDPKAVAFADDAHKAAQVIKPRERLVVYKDGSVFKAKLAQVLSSEPYGPEIPVLIGIPAAPATALTIGPLNEGTEDENTATWPPAGDDGSNDGVVLRIQTRQAYFDAGDEVWYAYIRELKWPRLIAPTISAETRIVIDVPE